ncbi:MAG: protein kinase [Gammaproteobacteria bacterium]|nr:protein kinase [Gammaproteobacteria bacterium]NIR82946.1 protein kinase [Gammaproteobacteria bacterium]NIR90311.1 protein kinase [Gammaproteobacteria bacterium]NIU04092.1 protein kinase [Gammaproteobacteria bacterium]NIV51388.1 protein kinase [Gammaproteobacteria bacterium]
MLRLPQNFGRYRVLETAGRGNMAVVYKAFDPVEERNVAVKVCATDDEATVGFANLKRKLLSNEARTAGQLDHPNILQVYDYGEDQDGQPYFVMEYVEGAQTLRPYCNVDNLLPIDTVVEITYKCAQALDYAHQRGVIHCDIKPSNIMLTQEGEVKIGDFSIAQHLAGDATQLIGMVGSPKYMSPEQIREDLITNQTDLYSLGVVAFELLTGKPPYSATNLHQLLYKIENAEAPPLRSLRPEVPETLERAVSQAMEKDVARRYQLGSEMADDLVELIGGREPASTDRSEEKKFRALRKLRFFQSFSDAEIWEVVRAAVWTAHAAGEAIITEGSVDLSFFVIVRGEVTVAKRGMNICTLGTGDCFGEMGYLAKTKRTASIVANTDVLVLKINEILMEQASMPCQLRFSRMFVRTLIERLARTSDDLSLRPAAGAFGADSGTSAAGL